MDLFGVWTDKNGTGSKLITRSSYFNKPNRKGLKAKTKTPKKDWTNEQHPDAAYTTADNAFTDVSDGFGDAALSGSLVR